MPLTTLPHHCLSVPGCRKRRLRYQGYCADHGPLTTPLPPSRCLAPLRCYCPECLTPKPPPLCPLPPVSSIREDLRARDYRRRHLAAVK